MAEKWATLHAEMMRRTLWDSGHECFGSEYELGFEKQTRLPEVIKVGVKAKVCHLPGSGEQSVGAYAPRDLGRHEDFHDFLTGQRKYVLMGHHELPFRLRSYHLDSVPTDDRPCPLPRK